MHLLWGYIAVDQIEPATQLQQENRIDQHVLPEHLENALDSLTAHEVQAHMAKGESDQDEMERRLQSVQEGFAEQVAQDRQRKTGGDTADHYRWAIQHVKRHGSAGFDIEDSRSVVQDSDSSLLEHADLPDTLWLPAGLIVLMWLLMLICQGEGVDLDIQKRRHPHFEWLMSHPVRPLAAFSGEMLAPLISNPLYAAAPLFWYVIFINTFSFGTAVVLSVAAGFAFAIAASCMSKALEIAAMLRLPVRSRGLVLGLVSFFGFVLMFFPVFVFQSDQFSARLFQLGYSLEMFEPASEYFRAMLVGSSRIPSIQSSAVATLALAGIIFTLALLVVWWGTRNGLQNNETRLSVNVTPASQQKESRIKNPYFRKELIWLRRDKAAVLQMILIPLAMVAPQAFNFSNIVQSDVLSWNVLAGLGILAGTYFLFNVGPRALASEGSALWIAQTWPQGLEHMLKAKAKLWFGVSTIVVYCVLLAAVLLFPQHWWRIVLVAAGWLIFGWGLAQKTICLVTAPSSSGEYEKPPRGRRWAAKIGTFAFSAGVFAESLHVAATGVVFSLITAAAMWQNLRARLPYLFDPWSERLPQPPTVMHAVIAIALMVEVMGLVIGIATVRSADALWLSRAIAYGVVGVIAWFLMHNFLIERKVPAREIWRWATQHDQLKLSVALPVAVLMGSGLAGIAYVYLEILSMFPATNELLVEADELSEKYASGKLWLLILAVGMAPLAEEYFFRGLLFRSLDREMHERKAIIISSAYFAFFHPPMAWVPVFLVGVFSAWIFKRSGWLLASVVVHMTYNFLIVMLAN